LPGALSHLLLLDSQDYGEHASALELTEGKFGRAVQTNRSILANDVREEFGTAPGLQLWNTRTKKWEEFTFVSMSAPRLREVEEAMNFVVRGLLYEQANTRLPRQTRIQVSRVNFLERERVFENLRSKGAFQCPPILGQYGSTVEWIGAVGQPSDRPSAIIVTLFYQRSLFIARVNPPKVGKI
jgi:hypothetical protein